MAKDISDPHADYGFSCLHYSVSEASGSIKINIINKQKTSGSVRVCTIDQEARSGEDYDGIDKVI